MMDCTCTRTCLSEVDITLHRELAGWGQFNILSDYMDFCVLRHKSSSVVVEKSSGL